MRLQLEAGTGGSTLDHPGKAGRRERGAPLADEHEGRCLGLPRSATSVGIRSSSMPRCCTSAASRTAPRVVASRCPCLFALATSTRASTSPGVRCSRVRSSAFGRLPGATVRFTSVGATSLRCDFAMENSPPRIATVRSLDKLRTVRKWATLRLSQTAAASVLPLCKGCRRIPAVAVRAECRWLGGAPTLVSCSVVDRPNVLSHNLKVDPIKPQNPSHARGSAG
jgi:hypothetical protein